MTNYFTRFAAAALTVSIQISSALAQSGPDSVKPPAVPAEIQLPAGHVAFLKAAAVGTQNYMCLPSGSSYAWKAIGPQATLFVTLKWINGEIRQQITTHYLSANPGEGGTHRPTWQHSIDTSAVWAKPVASSLDSKYVAAGAIPWLLLEVTGTQRGPTGGDALTRATYLHRVNTTGGLAPSSPCQAANVGNTSFVPYTADYVFYKAAQ